jgi:hypothetical protein
MTPEESLELARRLVAGDLAARDGIGEPGALALEFQRLALEREAAGAGEEARALGAAAVLLDGLAPR